MAVRALTGQTYRIGAAPAQACALARAVGFAASRIIVNEAISGSAVRLSSCMPFSGGTGVIKGTIAVKAAPANTLVSRPIQLYRDGTFVQEKTSGADGSYAFGGLDPNGRYYVVAFDMSGLYRPVFASPIPT